MLSDVTTKNILTTTDRSFVRPGQLSPDSTNGRKSPFRMPPRSATSPLPYRSPSPDLPLPQDCAFPPFPTPKSRSTTPTTPASPKSSFPSDGRVSRAQAEASSTYAPLSPRGNSGGRILQRMNTIAPGPFNVGDKGVGTHASPQKSTVNMSSSKDNTRPESVSSTETRSQRPSAASTNKSRKLSLSSISGGPRSTVNRAEFEKPALHSKSATLPPLGPDVYGGVPPVSIFTAKAIVEEPLHQNDVQSQTLPINSYTIAGNNFPSKSPPRRPSQPSPASRQRRPSVSAANRPLHEIGSLSTLKSYRPQPSRAASQASKQLPDVGLRSESRSESRTDGRLNNAPPVPVATRAEEFNIGNPYHTPTESTSSNESSGSDVNSGSSRSSPPLSDVSFGAKRTPSDIRRLNDTMNNASKSGVNTMKTAKLPEAQRGPTFSFSRPLYVRPTEPSIPIEPAMQPRESPMDPVIQRAEMPPTLQSSNRFPASLPSRNMTTSQSREAPSRPPYTTLPNPPPTTHINPAPTLQAPSYTLPTRRPTTANKGNCRGCGEAIKGKSVSSADGRLSGRYHKQCFVCKTCTEPFQTADFYVMEDHPYCSRHYHQLNGSLCKTCDRGIEGQYLESEVKQKFHPHCFTCQVSLQL